MIIDYRPSSGEKKPNADIYASYTPLGYFVATTTLSGVLDKLVEIDGVEELDSDDGDIFPIYFKVSQEAMPNVGELFVVAKEDPSDEEFESMRLEYERRKGLGFRDIAEKWFKELSNTHTYRKHQSK